MKSEEVFVEAFGQGELDSCTYPISTKVAKKSITSCDDEIH